MTVTEKFNDYAEATGEKLRDAGLRVEVDGRNEKIGYKIREARNERVSYIGVIGEKEEEAGTLSVRSGKEGELGAMSLDEFTIKLLKEIADKAL
ncbi:Threonine--tRNA ligase [bioreactor metagenome]|uniref:Threonine--tRNA ligase n=1 Tax=bioreactor metagenome TaxID=1076179 RepID=A0A645JLE7_9ZZZZ